MLNISMYDELSSRRLKIKGIHKLAVSGCYLSMKFHLKSELFSLMYP